MSFVKKPYNEKDISGCSLFGLINENGKKQDGSQITKAIALMHDRSNGLGGGFAAYGIYPDYKELYAFHIMFDDEKAKQETEDVITKNFVIAKDEKIPHQHTETIRKHPILWRYFIKVREAVPIIEKEGLEEEDFVVKTVMDINSKIEGSHVFSSGKNMGVFKAVGFPEDVAKFFKLEDYSAYIWTAHGRFPTNTPGWWGGAHPFGLLDWTIVHNGEISSYGINKRYLEMFGYKCTLLTDTEVVTYLFDLLLRRHKLPIGIASKILAAPFWKDIDRMPKREQELLKTARTVYSSALINGPFAVILGHKKGIVGLNDRIKLRPLVAGRKDDVLYISSEESDIHEIYKNPDKVWMPKAGEPVIGNLRSQNEEA